MDTKALLASLTVNGWVAEINIPASEPFCFLLSNGKDSIGGFSDTPSISDFRPSYLSVLLSPAAPNKLTLKCYLSVLDPFDGKKPFYAADTIIYLRAHKVDTVGNVVVFYEMSMDKGKASLAIGEYSAVPVHRAYRRLAFLGAMPMDFSGGGAAFRPSDSTSYIPIPKAADTLDFRVGVFHESAHDFFETAIDPQAKKRVGNAYRLLYEGKWADRSTMVRLFKESYYLKTDSRFGHPDDSESEFFASASALMRFFPELLGQNILKLEKTDKKQADMARHACNAVRTSYGASSPFAK